MSETLLTVENVAARKKRTQIAGVVGVKCNANFCPELISVPKEYLDCVGRALPRFAHTEVSGFYVSPERYIYCSRRHWSLYLED